MKRLLLTLFILFPFASGIHAQVSSNHLPIAVKATKSGNNAVISINGDFSGIRPKSTEMLEITPVLRSHDGTKELTLQSFAIIGSNRAKVYNRKEALNGTSPLSEGNYDLVIPVSDLKKQSIDYQHEMPFDSWMRNAYLDLQLKRIGCADCESDLDIIRISDKPFPDPYHPEYTTSYIVPKPEKIKMRSDSLYAYFNYIVARYNLLPNYKNNASELARVNAFITPILNDKDIQLSQMEIHGYASPEGSEPSNKTLSENRAKTFVSYLQKKYNFTSSQISSKGYGEDWNGVVKALERNPLPNNDQILEIINSTPNVDARDAKIRALDGGQTYATLVRDYYPALRRNDFLVSYIVKPFSVEEGKKILEKNPKYLSLDEMYRISETYEKGSDQFNRVFEIAASIFPNDEIAQTNVTSMKLTQHCCYDEVINRLTKFNNFGPALNNLGVAYALNGQYEEAAKAFNAAIAKGEKSASKNLEELNKVLQDL